MNQIKLRKENKFRTPIHGRNFQSTTTFVGALYPEGNVQVYWTWKWFDFQRHCGKSGICNEVADGNGVAGCREANPATPPIFRENYKIHGGSRWGGFQFQNMGHLIGMWDTREIITGLPYDFSHLITTHFGLFYKKHMTTFVLSQKEREALFG